MPHHQLNRREMLKTFASGFGMIGLAGLLAQDSPLFANPTVSDPWLAALSDPARASTPLAARPPMYPAKAKHVIFLFMSGGPSHVDTFDPKPKLVEYAGKPLPFEQPRLVRTRTTNCLPSPWKFKKHGQCGTEISELFP